MGRGREEGDTNIRVEFAIQYPEIYRNERNFFDTKSNIKVSHQDTYTEDFVIDQKEKVGHFSIIPPMCKHWLPSSSEKKYQYTLVHNQAGIKLSQDGLVETQENEGISMVVVENVQDQTEKRFPVNIQVQSIYTLAIEKPYAPLSIPMGSHSKLPIAYQK